MNGGLEGYILSIEERCLCGVGRMGLGMGDEGDKVK